MSIAVVRESTGEVITFLREDSAVPFAKMVPEKGTRLVLDKDLPKGWKKEKEPEVEKDRLTLLEERVTALEKSGKP